MRYCRQKKITRQHLVTMLKMAAVVFAIASLITPLRNALMPASLWYPPWDDVHTLKLLRIYLTDLFYPIDRSPYTGTCDHILPHLASLKAIDPDQLPAYFEDDWKEGLDKLKARLLPEDLWKVEHFRPSLSVAEQRELLHSVLIVTRAFHIFNITYFMAEGTLIGLHRHHGLIPWDDDVDIIFKASQWSLARQVLSCIEGFTLNMGSDFMWKFMWKGSKLWKGESHIRFPYVDLFPFNEDDVHLWPLTIWMKKEIIWRRSYAFPPRRLPLEGDYVSVPRDVSAILQPTYGDGVNEECASRTFQRKERIPFPISDRVRVPCRYLYEIYPFVFRQENSKEDGEPVQLRRKGGKVLSTFTYH